MAKNGLAQTSQPFGREEGLGVWWEWEEGRRGVVFFCEGRGFFLGGEEGRGSEEGVLGSFVERRSGVGEVGGGGG